MGGPFASALELTEATGLGVDQARAQQALRMASDAIRAFCGQELSVVEDDVEVVDPVSSARFLLSHRPVTAITQLQVLGVTLTSTEYTFKPWGRVERTADVFWSDGATVTYSHGFVDTDWEFGILRSIAIDAATRYLTLNESGDAVGMGSELMESRGFTPSTFLTEGEMIRLADYGKVLIG